MDRDGVINVKPPDGGYVQTWREFRFLPNISDWIQLFNALGLLVIVVTNQRGVALGVVRRDDLNEIHEKMVAELARAGAFIDDVFCCPHDKGECECRKPKPGLIEQAQRRWNIDLSRSLVVGDSDTDYQLAVTCGMNFVRVRDGRVVETVMKSGRPSFAK